MWVNLVNYRILIIPAMMFSMVAVGLLNVAPGASAAPPDRPNRDTGKIIEGDPVPFKRIEQGKYLVRPIVPYIAYDYPYYYGRGFYSRYIGPGYIYKVYRTSKEGAPKKIGRRLGSHTELDRCSRRFRSFERKTGFYTTYGGEKKRCPYLR